MALKYREVRYTMFINYDKYELLELFQQEPTSITGNMEDGELIYTYRDTKYFKLILTFDVYKQTCSVSITCDDLIVFSGGFTNVTCLKKSDDNLALYVNNKEKVKIKFSKQVGVELL